MPLEVIKWLSGPTVAGGRERIPYVKHGAPSGTSGAKSKAPTLLIVGIPFGA